MNDNNTKIKELKNKVGVLTGRVISLQLTLYREQKNVKHLYQHLGLKLEDEYDDIKQDEEEVSGGRFDVLI